MLPEVKKIKNLKIYTPQKWQTFLLRNWGMVSIKKMSEILDADTKTLLFEAKRLGLPEYSYNPKWLTNGYITLIRNNWHLLNYPQLMQLVEMTEEKLDFTLREDDFLNVKLGYFKPYCDEVKFCELTAIEIEETERIAKILQSNYISNYAKPFNFYSTENVKSKSVGNKDFDKIVYSYSTLYGDALLEGAEIIPDVLLEKLQSVGVNGVWMQGLLSKLSYYPFIEGESAGYEIRRKNLNKLIDKCAKYGIKIYLYLNEPRGLSSDKLNETTEKLKGREFEGVWSLCTEREEVKSYLYNAVKDLVKEVPNLGGFITITMSENVTNCFARLGNDCPICGKMKKSYVVPEVNNIIQRAISDSKTKVRLIANLWGWSKMFGWTEEEVYEGISNLDKKIDVLCVSEIGTILQNGKNENITEYSISRAGPCEETKNYLKFAKELGHKIMAKVQINNTWEFPILPYIPVFDLVLEHANNLKNIGVEGLMASWTLGGYPTLSIDLLNEVFSENYDYDAWLKERFLDNASAVKEASALFSEGFRHFPYHIDTVYFGPQALGAANFWHCENTQLKATMVTYPYDDMISWFGDRDLKEFHSELTILVEYLEKGLDCLSDLSGNEQFNEFKNFAEVFYANMKSSLLQTKFNSIKNTAGKEELLSLVEEEKELVKRLHNATSKDCRIGYEASQHYYFTQNTFLEKYLNIDFLEKLYS